MRPEEGWLEIILLIRYSSIGNRERKFKNSSKGFTWCLDSKLLASLSCRVRCLISMMCYKIHAYAVWLSTLIIKVSCLCQFVKFIFLAEIKIMNRTSSVQCAVSAHVHNEFVWSCVNSSLLYYAYGLRKFCMKL